MKRIVPFKERLRKRRRIVLFICTGNTCRSPMAAGLFRKLLDDNEIGDIEVRSAGVMTTTGLLASAEAIQVMDAEQVDLRRHRSTPLTPELIRKADLILAMSPFHRQSAVRLSEEARGKTYLLKEFTRSDLKNVQIADPMGCTLEVFKKTFKEIKVACAKLAQHEYVVGSDEDAPARKPARKSTTATKKTARKSPAKTPARSAAKSTAKSAAKSAAKTPARSAAKTGGKAARSSGAKKSKASSGRASRSASSPAGKSTPKSSN